MVTTQPPPVADSESELTSVPRSIFKQARSGELLRLCEIDARFLGLLLMLKKNLKNTGATATFKGLSPGLKIIFSLNKLDFK